VSEQYRLILPSKAIAQFAATRDLLEQVFLSCGPCDVFEQREVGEEPIFIGKASWPAESSQL